MFIDNELLKTLNMDLDKRLEILNKEYNSMLDYKSICNSFGSSLNYSSNDYNREGELLMKINETKDWINLKKL